MGCFMHNCMFCKWTTDSYEFRICLWTCNVAGLLSHTGLSITTAYSNASAAVAQLWVQANLLQLSGQLSNFMLLKDYAQTWSSLHGQLKFAPHRVLILFAITIDFGWWWFAMCVAAMLQQPRVPPTGQRQAIEIQIKWREVLAQKQAYLKILSQTTGHSMEKLDKVCSLLLLSWV